MSLEANIRELKHCIVI